ncbi:hypothetical protein PO124_27920 [Bacillus licheniformis]|nr:hypothetical protein [Bacillus licheniformis]
MRRIAAVLICLAVALIVAGCQNEDEGKTGGSSQLRICLRRYWTMIYQR